MGRGAVLLTRSIPAPSRTPPASRPMPTWPAGWRQGHSLDPGNGLRHRLARAVHARGARDGPGAHRADFREPRREPRADRPGAGTRRGELPRWLTPRRPARTDSPAAALYFSSASRAARASCQREINEADPRESDFRTAGPADTVDGVRLELARRQSVADPFVPGWLALVAAALLVAGGWKQTQRGATAAGGTP